MPARMKVTTVRFDEALWNLLAEEAGRSGVSVAQYVRDAALARAAFSAGSRAGAPDELLGQWAARKFDGGSAESSRRDAFRLMRALQSSIKLEVSEESAALVAESRQAQRRARSARSRAAGATGTP